MELESHKQLLSRLGNICKHHKELARASGAEFNLFKIIKVSNDEVKHSAFLAELLNPKGSHGQGDIFLKLFIEKLDIKLFHCEKAKVEVEKYIGPVTDISGGFIDIFIDDKKGNYITIENKIYADDQDNQLIRYSNFNKKIRANNLYYLTLKGNEPSKKSTNNTKFNIELKCDNDYKLLSYNPQILEWLELCHKEAASMPLLREGIAHYINLIKLLTGESTNKAMKQEMLSLLTESSTNLENAKEITDRFSEAQHRIQWEFWKALKNALLNSGLVLEENDKTVTSPKVWNYYHKKEKLFGLWSLIYRKDEVTIHWGCEVHNNFYSGFTIENNGKGGISNLPEYKKYRDIIMNIEGVHNPSDYWLDWQLPQPALNFRDFNSEAIFNLANKAKLEKTVNDIAEKAKRDISYFIDKLNETIKIEAEVKLSDHFA